MIHNRCPEWLKKKFATATSPGMAELPVESVEEPGSKAIVSAKNNEQPLRRKKEELGELKQFERILSHLDKFAKPAATKLGQTSKTRQK